MKTTANDQGSLRNTVVNWKQSQKKIYVKRKLKEKTLVRKSEITWQRNIRQGCCGKVCSASCLEKCQ